MNPAAQFQAETVRLENKHRWVLEMFAELDLSQILQQLGNALSPDDFATIVIERMPSIPKKKKETVCHNDTLADLSVLSADASFSDGETVADNGNKLIDKMLNELLHTLKVEWRSVESSGQSYSYQARNFLRVYFPSVRADFVDKMLFSFGHNVVATAIACFFAENNFGTKLKKLLPKLTPKFWLNSACPKLNVRKNVEVDHKRPYVPEEIRNQMNRFTQLMEDYQKKYPTLLSGLRLTKEAHLVSWERTEQEQPTECLVCCEKYPRNKMITCSAPTPPQDDEFPNENTTDGSPKPSSSAKVVLKNKNEVEVHAHAFCRGCIRGQAQAATDDVPLVEGGVGLPCMMSGCENPILYSEIRRILNREVRKKLGDRIIEENLGLASIENLERCTKCNFAMEMEVDKKVNKVFDCLRCKAKFCRCCERAWDDDHIGISCEELDAKNKDRKKRELEKKLNEAVIRKCPRCALAFVKSDGCNKMTCRCGMTQCYICRESGINYAHFCQHFRDPKIKDWKCPQCPKTCMLYEDAEKRDNQVIEEIRRKEDEAEGTSSGATAVPTASNGEAKGVLNRPIVPPNPPRQAQPPRIDHPQLMQREPGQFVPMAPPPYHFIPPHVGAPSKCKPPEPAAVRI